MPAEIIVPMTLVFGVASIAILPWGIKAARSVPLRIIIGLIYLAIILMAYFMGRAGIIADEQGISGSSVAPFFGTEWYFLLAFTVMAVVLQASLIQRTRAIRR